MYFFLLEFRFYHILGGFRRVSSSKWPNKWEKSQTVSDKFSNLNLLAISFSILLLLLLLWIFACFHIGTASFSIPYFHGLFFVRMLPFAFKFFYLPSLDIFVSIKQKAINIHKVNGIDEQSNEQHWKIENLSAHTPIYHQLSITERTLCPAFFGSLVQNSVVHSKSIYRQI